MKKGFTLIEVLSIIVILGIIAVLVLPKINTSSIDKKQKEYDKIVEIIENAGKSYLSSHPTEVAVEVNTLLIDEYLTSNIINPFTNTNITGCISKKVINEINEYEFGNSCVGNVSLTIDLDGGSIENTSISEYPTGSIVTLPIPVKANYTFDYWKIIDGNSKISANSLIIGTQNTIIEAQWIPLNYSIFYELNGGASTNPTSYTILNGNIVLTNPTKVGTTFAGWTGSNGNIPQKNVIISTSDAENKEYVAHWNRTATNIVSNGSFETDDLTFFSNRTYQSYKPITSNHVDGSRCLEYVASASYPENLAVSASTLTFNNTHKYYYSLYYISPISIQLYAHSGGYNGTTNNTLFWVGGVSTTTWKKASIYIYNNTFPSTNDFTIRFDNNNEFQTVTAYFDNILFVDLTETFGAGNEPTKEWCDANLNYFDGTKSLVLPW